MRNNHLGYRETMRKYFPYLEERNFKFLKRWERIFLEEGTVGLMTEKRGRKSTGRPRKKPLDKETENDLISELQRLKRENEYLRAENEYIKKLSALVEAEEQLKGKKRK